MLFYPTRFSDFEFHKGTGVYKFIPQYFCERNNKWYVLNVEERTFSLLEDLKSKKLYQFSNSDYSFSISLSLNYSFYDGYLHYQNEQWIEQQMKLQRKTKKRIVGYVTESNSFYVDLEKDYIELVNYGNAYFFQKKRVSVFPNETQSISWLNKNSWYIDGDRLYKQFNYKSKGINGKIYRGNNNYGKYIDSQSSVIYVGYKIYHERKYNYWLKQNNNGFKFFDSYRQWNHNYSEGFSQFYLTTEKFVFSDSELNKKGKISKKKLIYESDSWVQSDIECSFSFSGYFDTHNLQQVYVAEVFVWQ